MPSVSSMSSASVRVASSSPIHIVAPPQRSKTSFEISPRVFPFSAGRPSLRARAQQPPTCSIIASMESPSSMSSCGREGGGDW